MIAMNQLTLTPADPTPEPVEIAPVDESLRAVTHLINLWLSDKAVTTRSTYLSCLADYAAFVRKPSPAHAIAELLKIGKGPTLAVLLAYQAVLSSPKPADDRELEEGEVRGRGLSPATTNSRIGAMLSILARAHDLDMITWVVRLKAKESGCGIKDSRGPGTQAVAAMYGELTGRRDAKGARDRLVIALLWDLALRRGSLASLDLSHIDLERGVAWVLCKGRKEREWRTLPEPTKAAIAEWLTYRGTAPGPLLTALSHNGFGKRLSGTSINRIVVALGKRVGVRNCHAHSLRHSAITAALDASNGDVRTVRLYSMHKRIDTLLIYDDARSDKAGKISAMVAGLRGG